MDQPVLDAFSDEMAKISGHGTELLGLGTLAAPHAYNAVTGKKLSHKTERNAELGGLGILAAPSALAFGKQLLKKAGAFDKALHLADAGRVAGKAQAIAKQVKPQFTMDHLRQSYQAAGLKPGLSSALRKVSAAVTPQMMASYDAHQAYKQQGAAAAPKAAPKLTHPGNMQRANSLAEFTPPGAFHSPAAAAAKIRPMSAGPHMAPLGKLVGAPAKAGRLAGLLRRAV